MSNEYIQKGTLFKDIFPAIDTFILSWEREEM